MTGHQSATGISQTATSPAVVLGLGGCLDYELAWDESVVQRLADQYAVTPAQIDRHLHVQDERDLVLSMLGFMRDGVGGERFVATPEVVEAFAAHFPRRITLGGTSLRAAVAMSQHGLPNTVHLVSIDDRTRELLPPLTNYISSADHESRHPHLIVQYPAGAHVTLANEEIVAARANRLIYVNDTPNRQMNLSPGLGRLLDDADLFLVSGLNSVQDPDTLDARLSELRTAMGHLPDTSMVVFEDAGYHAPQARARVRDALIDRIDVYSMNEDELEDLLGHHVDLLDPGDVAAAVRELTHLVSAPTVVVHTQYWSLAAGVDPETFRPALQSGMSTAGARYLHADNVTIDDLNAMKAQPLHPTGAALAQAIEDLMPGSVCCVPAYALSPANPTTVGLGDAFVGGFIAGVVDGWPSTRDKASTTDNRFKTSVNKLEKNAHCCANSDEPNKN